MNSDRVASLFEVAESTRSHEDFWLYLRDFLDGFYACQKTAALEVEPPLLRDKFADGATLDAYLAATAEHLARESKLPVPAWTHDSSRVLREPYFAFDTYEGRMFLLVESPTAFRSRNIFVGADALSRV